MFVNIKTLSAPIIIYNRKSVMYKPLQVSTIWMSLNSVRLVRVLFDACQCSDTCCTLKFYKVKQIFLNFLLFTMVTKW